MHRIANRNSFNVVYFQHGIMDTSTAWVLHGPNHGLGQLAAGELGCDVYMGNFRGVHPQRQAEWRKKEVYWQNVGLLQYA